MVAFFKPLSPDAAIFSAPSPTVIDVKLVQPSKSKDNSFILPGMYIELSALQPLKAYLSILVTLKGITVFLHP